VLHFFRGSTARNISQLSKCKIRGFAETRVLRPGGEATALFRMLGGVGQSRRYISFW